MQKKQVCVLFRVSLLFLKLFFFCHDGNGPGRAQLETGRAGLGLIFLERQRAGPKNGPVQASSTLLARYGRTMQTSKDEHRELCWFCVGVQRLTAADASISSCCYILCPLLGTMQGRVGTLYHPTFGVRTNNFVESLNQKIKFLYYFFQLHWEVAEAVCILHQELNRCNAEAANKKMFIYNSRLPRKFCSKLTPAAVTEVNRQLTKACKWLDDNVCFLL